jgi:hypothetical protein
MEPQMAQIKGQEESLVPYLRTSAPSAVKDKGLS